MSRNVSTVFLEPSGEGMKKIDRKILYVVSGRDPAVMAYVERLRRHSSDSLVVTDWPEAKRAWGSGRASEKQIAAISRRLGDLAARHGVRVIHCLSEEENDLLTLCAIRAVRRLKRRVAVVYENRKPWGLSGGELSPDDERSHWERFCYEHSDAQIFPTDEMKRYFFERYWSDPKKACTLDPRLSAGLGESHLVPSGSKNRGPARIWLCDVSPRNPHLYPAYQERIESLVREVPEATFFTHVDERYASPHKKFSALSRRLGSRHYQNRPERSHNPAAWDYDFSLAFFPLWCREREREWLKRAITPEAASGFFFRGLPVVSLAPFRGLAELIRKCRSGALIHSWDDLRSLARSSSGLSSSKGRPRFSLEEGIQRVVRFTQTVVRP